jgi:hypothetical protein
VLGTARVTVRPAVLVGARIDELDGAYHGPGTLHPSRRRR